jgi:two-component system OmpR family response regulator
MRDEASMARRFSAVVPRPTTLAEAWRCTHRPRVIVADADPEVRDGLASGLGGMGMEVLEAQSRAELDELLHPASWHPERSPTGPDLIVIGDLPPAGVGGLEALRRLRVIDRTTPVILLSAVESPAAHVEAARLGVSAFLYRPVDFEELESLIACLVEEPRARARRPLA